MDIKEVKIKKKKNIKTDETNNAEQIGEKKKSRTNSQQGVRRKENDAINIAMLPLLLLTV